MLNIRLPNYQFTDQLLSGVIALQERLSLYVERDSVLHRLNPLTKLTLTVSLILVDFFGPGYWLPTGIFLLLLVPLSVWGRLSGVFLRTTLRLLLPLFAFLFVMQSLFYPGGKTALFGVWIFSVKLEGVQFAYLTASRLLTMVGLVSVAAAEHTSRRADDGSDPTGHPAGLDLRDYQHLAGYSADAEQSKHHHRRTTGKRFRNRRRHPATGAGAAAAGRPLGLWFVGGCGRAGNCHRGPRI